MPDVYEQTLRVDGDAPAGSRRPQSRAIPIRSTAASPGRAAAEQVRARRQPGACRSGSMANVGVSQQLTSAVGAERQRHVHDRQQPVARTQHQRAASDGVRPDPSLRQRHAGRVHGAHARHAGAHRREPQRAVAAHHDPFANYSLVDQENDADGAFSLPADSYNLAGEWGPAAGIPRHSAARVVNTPLPYNFRLGLTTSARTGTPLQHHHGPRRQRRHGVQRSARRRRPQHRHRRRDCGTWPRD